MLDHLLDKFEEKDKIILHKMIQASFESDDEADLAHRVFKSVSSSKTFWFSLSWLP